MKTRIISAIILLPLLGIIYFGGPILLLACLLVGLLGVREFYMGFEQIGVHPSHLIGYVSTFALYGIGILNPDPLLYMPWFAGVVIAGLISLFPIDGKQLSDGMVTMIGVFYVVFFSYHVVLIDQTEVKILIWLVLLTAFGTDTFAYITGLAMGKHKLCPKISPKKTIEGAIGGVLGSGLLSIAFGYFFGEAHLLHFATIGLFGSVFAQLGDLTASVFKRKMGIKDYGTLIPGHGGIMDRFDSVLFTAPFVYYYIVLVIY